MLRVPCPVCGHAGVKTWFELGRGTVARCVSPDCGVGYVVNQPNDEQLDALYRDFYYPEHGNAVFDNSTAFKSQQHLDALDRRLSLVGKRVLDYGCGVGNFLAEADGRGFGELNGVEFDDVGRAEARARGFRVEKTIDSYEAASIDFVYMNDVIEHLRDPVTDLREIRSRLSRGAALFVVTMNMRSVNARIQRDRWSVVTNPTHLWFYDATSLERTLREAGFGRVEIQRWPVRFDHHGRLRRLVQRGLQATGLDSSLRMLAWSC